MAERPRSRGRAKGGRRGRVGKRATPCGATHFQHLIDGFHNRDSRSLAADLLGGTIGEYTGAQMTHDLRRLRLKRLIFRPPRTNRYFVTPYGWKVARLFSRLGARVFRPVFRPAVAMFTGNDAVLPFPLRASLDRVDG